MEVYARAGLMGHRRARRVIFHEAAFQTQLKNSKSATERFIDLPLFDDYKPRIKLVVSSPYASNQNIHDGQLVHDPASQVHFFVEHGQMSGDIEAAGHKIKIVNVGGAETFIVEEEP
jgi:hypothetical protein